MIEEYHDYLGNKIEIDSKTILDSIDKVLIDATTGLAKIKIKYYSNKIFSVNYYITDEENENEKVIDLNLINKNITIIRRTFFKEFVIENCNEYIGETLFFKYRLLKNKKNQIICHEDISIETTQIVKIKKYFFEDDNEIEKIYASYFSDGTLKHMLWKPVGDDNEQDWESFDMENHQSFLNNNFNLDMTYYFNGDFLPK